MAGAGKVVKLRLVLTSPPPAVLFSLEGKGGAVECAQRSTGHDLAFDLALRVVLGGSSPRFLGDYARGGVEDRFFYFCSGIYAGDRTVDGGRRGKVALGAIPETMVREALRTGGVLQAVTAGTHRDGGAACASVRSVWSLVA